jgi:uncharacterized protein
MIYNCHIHTFRDCDIPEKFLPLGLVRLMARNKSFRLISKILNYLNPFTDNDTFDKYVNFIKTGRLGSQEEIFKKCLEAYKHDDAAFFVLTMDMEFMGAGKVPRSYDGQLSELAELTKKYPQLHAFVHIDPRRDGYLELFRKCVDEWGFKGLKIYPPIGYFPYDERLFPIYDYCQQMGIPVMAHCSPYNPTHFKGKYSDLYALLKPSHHPINVKGKNRKELCSQFTHPRNWLEVSARFPDLKVCFAHFGSAYYWERYLKKPNDAGNWVNIIKELIGEHPNFYADVSFTMHDSEFFPVLKGMMNDDKLKDKILFGSDFYMVETKDDEVSFVNDLRHHIGDALFMKMAFDNVIAYSGLGNASPISMTKKAQVGDTQSCASNC